MRPTVSQYAQALTELMDSPVKGDMLARNFIGWLKRRGETKKLPAIVEQMQKMEREKDGKLSVRAITSHEIAAETKEKLAEQAAALFPGKRIELHHEINSDLIGGVELRTEEMLYSATIRAELDSLKKSLLKA